MMLLYYRNRNNSTEMEDIKKLFTKNKGIKFVNGTIKCYNLIDYGILKILRLFAQKSEG